MAEVDRELAQRIVDFLNELLELDAEAVVRLLNLRVQCGEGLAKHPSVQVWGKGELTSLEGGSYGISVLGLLNGLAGVDVNGWGAVAAQCHLAKDDPTTITGIECFEVLERRCWNCRASIQDAIPPESQACNECEEPPGG